MELRDLMREKILTEIIAERDGFLIQLCQENEQLKEEVSALKERNKDSGTKK